MDSVSTKIPDTIGMSVRMIGLGECRVLRLALFEGTRDEQGPPSRPYPKGVKISDELAKVRLRRAELHGDWNYTIAPSSALDVFFARVLTQGECRPEARPRGPVSGCPRCTSPRRSSGGVHR